MSAAADRARDPLPWITVSDQSRYFVTDTGAAWTPIGHNDAITWPHLAALFRRRDVAQVERHLEFLVAHGVTCLRLMLEYAQVRHRYIEKPAGRFVPSMVALWDDLFRLCERVGLRILLTPVDTFWTWLHWRHHPWNHANGGPCTTPSTLLLCPQTRAAIKHRLDFAVRRWGGSGALFAWDLWNEIHPAQGGDSADAFDDFIHDLSQHVRSLEIELYGRSHPQTVSLFGPELVLKPHLDLTTPIFRHPDLDFATIHIYETGTIDDPQDAVAPAVAMGAIVRSSLAELTDQRPFLDTEHGPIHSFKDKHKTLPAAFDDVYFRHVSWAHLASGGAGGGMRWPNRHPHTLTVGMHAAQRAMAAFLPLVDWTRLVSRNLNAEVTAPGYHPFACGDADQVVAWLLRATPGAVVEGAEPVCAIPVAGAGIWQVRLFDTIAGVVLSERDIVVQDGAIAVPVPRDTQDVAIAARRLR